jgi:prepilin-type N-terminal cleavage/methylation domain-containing protein
MIKIAQKKNLKAGFTLIELMVTLSIFVIVSGIVLFNQGKFNSSIVLTNLAYDVALGIRQAQIFGVSGKVGSSAIGMKPQYGVNFKAGTYSDDTVQFKMFSDADNNFYLTSENETLETMKISRGNYISQISIFSNVTGTWTNVNDLSIVFRRPEAEAYFYATAIDNQVLSNQYNEVKIRVTSDANPDSFRNIVVTKIGLIYVEK